MLTLTYGDFAHPGEVHGIIDPNGHTTGYTYDSLNRITATNNPLNQQTSHIYDGAGNLTSLVDPMNRTTSYTYDAANQLTGIAYSDGTPPNVSFAYDNLGRRISMSDGTGTSTYSYDSLGRLTQSKQGNGQTIGYGYDLAGNLTSLTYPDSSQVTRSYDAANRLTAITDWLQHTTHFDYDADGNLVTQTYLNSVTAALSYDNADQLTQISDSKAGTPFWTFGYGRDSLGQLSSASDPVENLSHSYSYDTLDRLTSDQRSTGTRSWSYDAADQLTSTSDTASNTTSSFTYDAAHELTSLQKVVNGTTTDNVTLSYDAVGERSQSVDTRSCTGCHTDVSYRYDQGGRLTSVTRYQGDRRHISIAKGIYTYNGDGLRMTSTGQSLSWDVAEGPPVIIQEGGTRYVTGPGGLPLEQVDQSGRVLYYLQDQLGSIRGLVDGSGNTTATYSYGPYGELLSRTGSVSNPFAYAGQYTDWETGLRYLRSRYYDPSTAQLLTVDPMQHVTMQKYSYAGGDTAGDSSQSPCACGSGTPLPPRGALDWLWSHPANVALPVVLLVRFCGTSRRYHSISQIAPRRAGRTIMCRFGFGPVSRSEIQKHDGSLLRHLSDGRSSHSGYPNSVRISE